MLKLEILTIRFSIFMI